MRIVITGANSATGQAILRRGSEDLAAANELVAAVRSAQAANQIPALLRERNATVRISYDDPASLDDAFEDATAIIHLAGILVERPGSTYESANVAPVRSIIEAARRCAVDKFVLVSAIGADEKSPNRYYRSKGQAEAIVRASGLRYTILRAPLLLGPGTEGDLDAPHSWTYVDDVARATLAAAQPPVASNRTLDLVGPVSLPERELVDRAARILDHQVRITSIPKGLLSFALAIRQRLAGPGFSLDALEVITASTRLDSQLAATELGIQLTGIDEMIKKSLEQDRKK